MAGKAADWDQLLLQSQDLVTSSEAAFPRVQRDILQVEQYSQKLRSRAVRADASADTLEASRLLANEGLNPRKLTQALQTFELRPTYEDVFQVETATVEEYLQQVHEMISVTAIQEAQQSAVAAFDDFMDSCMDSEWQQEKRALFDSVAPYSSSTALTPGPSPGGHMSPYAARPLPAAGLMSPGLAYRGTPLLAGRSPLGGAPLAASNLQLRGRAAKYAGVVKKMNAAAAAGQAYDAVREFAAACADDTNGERRTTMLRVWQVLGRVLGGAAGLAPAARTQRSEALLAGARGYLEDNYVSYMQKVVAAHRAQASLGGAPGRLGLVHAFLRVKEKERGALDFDQPGGVDTTWQRIYCCLRAGFHSEAAQVSKSTREASTPRVGSASDLSAQLLAWGEGGCRPLTGDPGVHTAAECERLLRDKSARQRHPFSAQRAMVHALLCGNNRAAEAVAKETPSFFPTIEDFLWFKLCLVRTQTTGASSSSGGGAGSSGGLLDAYQLSDLQQYLQQYPASHYSHNGKEPLLYVVVLLLSLQFRAAVGFLSREAATKDYRLDAVHLAICLQHASVLDPSPADGGGGGGRALDVGSLIHRYGKEFLYTDPQLALEYYMLAAAALGGSVQVKGQLLRELLVESKAYGYLLGSGGAAGEGGALARFVPNPAERGAVLEAVAHECAASAQLEEAVELFMFAGRPRPALRILNQRLSDAVEAAATSTARGGEVSTIVSRGDAAVAAMGSTQDPDDLREIEALDLLKSIGDMLAAKARGDHVRALQKLGELSFVPTERFRLQLCASSVNQLHPAVADRLPSVLLAAATALAASGKREQLQTVVAFAAAVSNRISQAMYQQLNQLQAGVSA
ncbi:Nuclear pore complex protein NUP93A [Chlorella vulgaris]